MIIFKLAQKLFKHRSLGTREKYAPYVNASLVYPADHPTHGAAIDFLVDSGSEVTILCPKDARRLGVEQGKADFQIPGIDGSKGMNCRVIEVEIWFQGTETKNKTNWHRFMTEISIDISVGADWGKYSSVMGRDLLRHFRFTLDSLPDEGIWISKLKLKRASKKLMEKVSIPRLQEDTVTHKSPMNLSA